MQGFVRFESAPRPASLPREPSASDLEADVQERSGLAPQAVEVLRREDGSLILRSPVPLEDPGPHLLHSLKAHAARTPDRIFLAERMLGAPLEAPWRTITFARALNAVQRLAQSLLDLGLSASRPLLLLSDNGLDQGLLTLACQYVGIPAVPVSPAYSLMSRDFARLKFIAGLVTPGAIYAIDATRFAGAFRALQSVTQAPLVVGWGGVDAEDPTTSMELSALPNAISYASLLKTAPTPAIEEALAQVGPDTVAKILFTSGSTGMPKGVINTQRMMTSNQQSLTQLWPFLTRTHHVLVEWLPWSHTFGGNHNFNLAVRHGASLYIDDGKPAPGLIERSVRNLKDVSPTLYFNVPRGYDMLLPFLEQDEALRDRFFARLQGAFYAAAALPQPLWDRLTQVSLRSTGRPVLFLSGWGSTETAPLATSLHYRVERTGIIGLPAIGTEIKLAPVGDKLELRVRGPNVTPGYFQRADLTAAAFDEEGFYRTGDAGRLEDPQNPARGLVFNGRIAEDFKLMTGTWVHVGALRIQLVAALSPWIQDAVIAGHDREEVGALLVPNPLLLKQLAPAGEAELPMGELVSHPAVLAKLTERLESYNAQHPGASSRIARALLLVEPPAIDFGEITDKGYINQRAVLDRRAQEVVRLFSTAAEVGVMVCG